jgi:hypothetical protein
MGGEGGLQYTQDRFWSSLGRQKVKRGHLVIIYILCTVLWPGYKPARISCLHSRQVRSPLHSGSNCLPLSRSGWDFLPGHLCFLFFFLLINSFARQFVETHKDSHVGIHSGITAQFVLCNYYCRDTVLPGLQ